MPELPEVQTTVNGINRDLKGLRILDVWTDYSTNNLRPTTNNLNQIKNSRFFKKFKRNVVGAKILGAERRAKNILIHLSDKNTILIHMKMTGHLLYGRYEKRRAKNENRDKTKNSNLKAERRMKTATAWVAVEKGPLRDDSYNQFIHLVFVLSNGKHLALSDVRKFAKVTVLPTNRLEKELSHLGPEPLDKSFKLKAFGLKLKERPSGKIKQVLMDQEIVSGVGNIYSDEILWASGIHPLRQGKSLKPQEIKCVFRNMLKILKKGIKLGGDSLSDYRRLDGKRGKFQYQHKAYQKTNEPCSKKNCRGIIKRVVIGGRSAHFCSAHQK
jgi:formamidopyrimidine-DNA glycosylase